MTNFHAFFLHIEINKRPTYGCMLYAKCHSLHGVLLTVRGGKVSMSQV